MQAAESSGLIASPTLNEIDSGLRADTITIAAAATGYRGEATGMLAYNDGQNLVTAVQSSVDINATARSGNASAMTAMGEKAVNTVTADAYGPDDAYGMRADHTGRSYSAGFNTIAGTEVKISANALGSGTAYGVMANLTENTSSWCTGGINTIQALDGNALTVIIKVTAGSADKAYTMCTSGKGTNKILGDDGNDLVDFTGRIEGNNLIDTGAGNDTISLDGKVDANLVLKAGDGYDLLILRATGTRSFTENYQEWLGSLTDAQLKEMEIEEI